MYKYTVKVQLESNIDSNDIYDADAICKEIGVNDYTFETNNDYYNLRLYVQKLSASVPKLILCIELYNSNNNEIEITKELLSIEGFKQFLGNSLNKFVSHVHSSHITVVCFEKSDNLYVKDGKLIAEVYNFNYNKFYGVPKHREITLQLYSISVSDILNNL